MGFAVLPNAQTFKNDHQDGKGIVLGRQGGFLLAVGLVKAHNNTSLAVMVRFRKGSPTEAIQSKLKELPTFKGFAGRKTLQIGAHGLVTGWPYAFKKPTPDEVAAFVDEVVAELQGLALPFCGKCEECCSHDVDDVTLMNRVPGYLCVSCQSRMAADKKREQEEYNNRPANYLLGLPVGILAAAVGGTVWGLGISAIEAGTNSWTPKLHFIVGFGIAALVAWTMFKATGKITRVGQGIAILLTLAGKFWGDALFYTFDVMYSRGAHISLNALSWTARDSHLFQFFLKLVLRHFWTLKLSGFERILVLAGDLASACLLFWVPWGRLPKFVPNFEYVGKVPERNPQRLSANA